MANRKDPLNFKTLRKIARWLILACFMLSFVLPGFTVSADTPVFDTVDWGSLPQMVVGTSWSYTFEATSDDGGIAYSISSGSIPGLSINQNTGVYSGTPTAIGSYAITVTATDDADDSTSISNTFTVKSPTITQITEVSTTFPGGGFTLDIPVWVHVQLDPATGIARPANAQVTISANNGGPSCTADIDDSGAGECGLTFTSTGSYTVTASYAGSTYYLSSSDTYSIQVQDLSIPEMLLAGRYHSCHLDSAGNVDCWGFEESYTGYDVDGNPVSSIEDSQYVQFSAGGYHTCGLKADGSIVCWGDSTEINDQVPNTVNGKPVRYIRLNSGDDHVCAIDSKYRLHCWGEMTDEIANNIPSGQFTAVDAGVLHDCAIEKNGGDVVCWGENDARIVVPSGLSGVKQVSVGNAHSCVVKSDNKVDCWGTAFPDPSTSLTFQAIDSGSNYSCGITSSDTAVCWGTNALINDTPSGTYSLLGSGLQHSCAVNDAAGGPYLNCWGNNEYLQAPHLDLSPDTVNRYFPNQSDWSQTFTAVGGNEPYSLTYTGSLPGGISLSGMTLSGTFDTINTYNFSLILEENYPGSSIYPMELKPVQQSYIVSVESPETTIQINSRTEVADAGSPVVVNVTVSKSGTPDFAGFVTILGSDPGVSCQAAVNASGTAECAIYFGTAGTKTITADYDGDDFYIPTAVSATTTTTINPVVIDPMVTAGDQFNCSIDSSGHPYCWGKNDSGQTDTTSIPGYLVFKSISAGTSHVCGLTTMSKPYCWGWNGYGVRSAPDDFGFKQITSGETHSCGLKYDGTVKCWGNTAANRTNPPAVLFKTIDAGANHTCGIRSDNNRVECWGENTSGQTNPGVYSTLAFASLDAGQSATCGILSTGVLTCWGSISTVPSGTYLSLSVGGAHACAVNTANQMACWGSNTSGQAVSLAGSYDLVAAGSDHNCAIRTDGHMKCWGNNTEGQAPVLSIQPDTMPTLSVNQSWTAAFAVAGGRAGQYAYSVHAGALPTGLVLDSATGAVTGTLTTGADYSFTIRVIEQNLVPALINEKTYNQRVKADSVAVVTAVSVSEPVMGQPVWLHFQVSEAANSNFASIPTGALTASIDGETSCELTLQADGRASCLVFFETAGTKSLHVAYAGDDKFLPSSNLGSETLIEVAPFLQGVQLHSGDLQTYIHRPDGTLTCIGDGCALEVFNQVYTAFDSGGGLSCGLQTDGQIKCLDGSGVTLYPGPFQTLEVGEGHACAMDLDRNITCWGENTLGQTAAPLGTYRGIFAGEGASCALTESNQAVCWGDPAVTAAPAGIFYQISIGSGFACGLRDDLSVTCWGEDRFDQLSAPSGSGYSSLTSGSHHTCAMGDGNEISCWGVVNDQPVASPYGVFVALSGYQDHVCALRGENWITCWGEDDAGEAPQILIVHLEDNEIVALRYWEHFFEPQNGVPPYIGWVSYGSLPAGIDPEDHIRLSPSGLVIYGTPGVPGRYDFAIRWWDDSDPHLVWEELHRVTVTGADLAVSVEPAHPYNAFYENDFWFEYTLTNNTPLNVPDVLLAIDLPQGFEDVSVQGIDPADCLQDGLLLTCSISEFLADSTRTVRVSGTVDRPVDTEMTTTAAISTTLEKWPEVKASDNVDSVTVKVAYQAVLLDEDFSAQPSSAWAAGSSITAPSGESYLGDFRNDQQARLVLSDLAPHRKVTVRFDLYVIGGWQGNGTTDLPLPALFQFGETSKTALVTTTFGNLEGSTQAYPGMYPSSAYPAFHGAVDLNRLAFTGINDAVYSFEYRFNHTDPLLDLSWIAENLPDGAVFGLDNLVVSLDSGWEFIYLPLTIR